MTLIQAVALAGCYLLIREVVAPALYRLTEWRLWATLSTCWICAGFHAGWLTWLVATTGPEAALWALAGVAVGAVAVCVSP